MVHLMLIAYISELLQFLKGGHTGPLTWLSLITILEGGRSHRTHTDEETELPKGWGTVKSVGSWLVILFGTLLVANNRNIFQTG